MTAFRGDSRGVQHPFDGLASCLAGRSVSRRRALQLAGASLLGAAGPLGSAGTAEARPTCPRRGACCSRRCENTRKVCFCIRTTEATGPACTRIAPAGPVAEAGNAIRGSLPRAHGPFELGCS